jgi:hypothetical protein
MFLVAPLSLRQYAFARRSLLGGEKDDAPNAFGLKQLTSPPVSARALAVWLLESYNNHEAPLRTLDLLIAERGGPKPFFSPSEGSAIIPNPR